MSTGSRAFSNETPDKPHLLRSGGKGGEIADLRDDTEAGFYRYEKREGYPKISRVVGGTAVSLAALPASKDLVGTGLAQGQTAASLTVGTGTAELVFTANRPGTPGNNITVELKTGGAGAIAVTGTDIVVTLNTGTTDADAVKALVDGDTDATRLVQVTSGGAGVVAVTAATALSGGLGEGVNVYANGIAQEVEGSITETAIPLVVADLTGAANGDAVVLQVESDGVYSDPITLGVVT